MGNEQSKRLKKELEHLEKTYKAGIMDKEEFMKGKERIEKKITDVAEKRKLEEKKKKIVSDILNKEKPKKTKTTVKAKKPVKKKKVPGKIEKKKVQKKEIKKEEKKIIIEPKENNKFDIYADDFDEPSSTWKFALVILIILLSVLLYVKWSTPGIGPTNIVITEYSDYECSYCADVQETLKQIEDEYGSAVEFRFRHFPLDNHPNALLAAQAAECANDQGYFWEYHEVLFENTESLERNNLEQYALDIGLNYDLFILCLDSEAKLSQVLEEKEQGEKLGVEWPPTFFVNNQMIVGAHSYDVFKEVIDEELGIE